MDQYDYYDTLFGRTEDDWSEVCVPGEVRLSRNNKEVKLSSSSPVVWRGIDLTQRSYYCQSEEPLILTDGGLFLKIDGPESG
jgi:hypothetical protein